MNQSERSNHHTLSMKNMTVASDHTWSNFAIFVVCIQRNLVPSNLYR